MLGRVDLRVEAGFLRILAAGDFVPVELTKTDYERMAELVEQYADLPLGTSDAAVVAVAERLKVAEVATRPAAPRERAEAAPLTLHTFPAPSCRRWAG